MQPVRHLDVESQQSRAYLGELAPVRCLRAAAAVIVCAVALAGCRASRSQDCERFVTSVNEVLSEIDRHVAAVDGGELTNVNDMRTLAGLYETLGHRIENMRLSTPELARDARSYQSMVRLAAAAATQVANALVADELEKALIAQQQFTALVAEEDKVVQRINELCAQR
jgi:hypothetical protein